VFFHNHFKLFYHGNLSILHIGNSVDKRNEASILKKKPKVFLF
jgi:hypothetical protein